jgi:hypothetical protein
MMPSLEDYSQNDPIKMLVLGNSGAGKTGLIATLAKDYRVFIADFDNGLPILMDEKVLAKDLRKNIYFKSFYDPVKPDVAGRLLPSAEGWNNFVLTLRDWKESGNSLGSIHSWAASDVFVIDSLTFMGNAIFNSILQLAGKLGQRPDFTLWGAAVDAQEAVLETLFSPAVKCNVVITSHLRLVGDETAGGIQKLFPSGITKNSAQRIGRYFNNVVLVQKSGFGNNVKREIITTATSNTELKTTKPSKVPAIIPPDLGNLFNLLKSTS